MLDFTDKIRFLEHLSANGEIWLKARKTGKKMDFIKKVESETILNAYAKSGHCIVCFCDADRIFADVSLPLRSLSDRCFVRHVARNFLRLRGKRVLRQNLQNAKETCVTI